jgi:hypothetical protein
MSIKKCTIGLEIGGEEIYEFEGSADFIPRGRTGRNKFDDQWLVGHCMKCIVAELTRQSRLQANKGRYGLARDLNIERLRVGSSQNFGRNHRVLESEIFEFAQSEKMTTFVNLSTRINQNAINLEKRCRDLKIPIR